MPDDRHEKCVHQYASSECGLPAKFQVKPDPDHYWPVCRGCIDSFIDNALARTPAQVAAAEAKALAQQLQVKRIREYTGCRGESVKQPEGLCPRPVVAICVDDRCWNHHSSYTRGMPVEERGRRCARHIAKCRRRGHDIQIMHTGK